MRQPAGGFGTDPFGQSWTWDNTDIRYANSTRFGGFNVTYGITANNNPTVQDPWNTTPAWAFPYVARPSVPALGPPQLSTALLHSMSPASAPTRLSTTRFTLKRRSTHA